MKISPSKLGLGSDEVVKTLDPYEAVVSHDQGDEAKCN